MIKSVLIWCILGELGCDSGNPQHVYPIYSKYDCITVMIQFQSKEVNKHKIVTCNEVNYEHANFSTRISLQGFTRKGLY